MEENFFSDGMIVQLTSQTKRNLQLGTLYVKFSIDFKQIHVYQALPPAKGEFTNSSLKIVVM